MSKAVHCIFAYRWLQMSLRGYWIENQSTEILLILGNKWKLWFADSKLRSGGGINDEYQHKLFQLNLVCSCWWKLFWFVIITFGWKWTTVLMTQLTDILSLVISTIFSNVLSLLYITNYWGWNSSTWARSSYTSYSRYKICSFKQNVRAHKSGVLYSFCTILRSKIVQRATKSNFSIISI